MLIHMRGIQKYFEMGKETIRAVDGVALDVEENEFVALMGASGSGKTTLMNIIGCLDSPTTGYYELRGKDVTKMDDSELAQVRNQEIGFVFQTFNLLPRATAFKNVELPLIYAGIGSAERTKRVEESLASVSLKDRMKHRPTELSGGERQRVAIARALVNSPSIILADEPTGNLDSENEREIMELIVRLNRENGQTFVLVTHSDDVAKSARRIITMRDGEIISDMDRNGDQK